MKCNDCIATHSNQLDAKVWSFFIHFIFILTVFNNFCLNNIENVVGLGIEANDI